MILYFRTSKLNLNKKTSNECYEKAIEYDPTNWFPYAAFGKFIRCKVRDPLKARFYYEKALNMMSDPDLTIPISRLHLYQGYALLLLEYFQEDPKLVSKILFWSSSTCHCNEFCAQFAKFNCKSFFGSYLFRRP